MTPHRIGRRQACVLVVLALSAPEAFRGLLVASILIPGGNNTHRRRGLQRLIDLGLVRTWSPITPDGDLLSKPIVITQSGIEHLQWYADTHSSLISGILR